MNGDMEMGGEVELADRRSKASFIINAVLFVGILLACSYIAIEIYSVATDPSPSTMGRSIFALFCFWGFSAVCMIATVAQLLLYRLAAAVVPLIYAAITWCVFWIAYSNCAAC